jgi:iron complex transport system permease protein
MSSQALAPEAELVEVPRPRAGDVGWRWMGGCLAVLAAAVLLGVALGPVSLPLAGTLRDLASHLPLLHVHSPLSTTDSAIVWQIRVPRVVLGAIVGAMLALAGATYQAVFRNPLADPYLLGTASGAELGATVAIAYAPAHTILGANVIQLSAFVGAVAAVAATYALGSSVGMGRSPAALILAGVAIASLVTAIETYVEQTEPTTVREVFSWILGRLGTAGWSGVELALPYVVVCAGVILAHRRVLDVMVLGDDEAASLGVAVGRTRVILIAAATIGTAAVISVSGTIGFVGIIVPHTVRLMRGGSYRVIIPLSMILGAALLVLADLIARTVVAPAELPIGVITAFLGAPFFLFILRRSRSVIA